MNVDNHPDRTDGATIQFVGHKHLMAYVWPGILTFIGLILVSAGGILLLVGLVPLGLGITRILDARGTRWIVTNDGVTVQSGYLPWRTGSMTYPAEHIYESFYHRGLLGHYMDYGTVTLRRTDGTTAAADKYMARAHDLTGYINGLAAGRRDETRAAARAQINLAGDIRRTMQAHAAVTAPAGSRLDDLHRLADLLDRGVIDEAEFSREKQRLLS